MLLWYKGPINQSIVANINNAIWHGSSEQSRDEVKKRRNEKES